MSKFSEHLTDLGFASYASYLRSDHWKDFKERYRQAGLSRKCAVCSGSPVQLHHHTYARLGAEKLTDVTPLCGPHHEAVHAWLHQRKKFVRDTPQAVKALGGGTPGSRGQRKKEKRKAAKAARRAQRQAAALAEQRKQEQRVVSKEKRKKAKDAEQKRRLQAEFVASMATFVPITSLPQAPLPKVRAEEVQRSASEMRRRLNDIRSGRWQPPE